MNEHFFIYNGFLFRSKRPVITPDHPSFAFGDGLFETMLMHDGNIINRHLHFDRLRKGMKVLQYETPTSLFEAISENINILVKKNHEKEKARVRLSLTRSANSFGDFQIADYLIETEKAEMPVFGEKGLSAVIYEASTKGIGILSNLKTKNFLLSILAFRHAKAENADEGIILNAQGRVSETSIANIYFIEGDQIFTPALSEGCVAGTVRQWLIHQSPGSPFRVFETECTIDRLMHADEVFISNAIRWIQPVRNIGDKEYPIDISRKIFRMMETALL